MLTSRKPMWLLAGLMAMALVLGACSLQSKSPAVNNDQSAVQTAAAETVSAQLNQDQGGLGWHDIHVRIEG